MTGWTMAFTVFALGFSGVFITLAPSMIAIITPGFIIAKLSNANESE